MVGWEYGVHLSECFISLLCVGSYSDDKVATAAFNSTTKATRSLFSGRELSSPSPRESAKLNSAASQVCAVYFANINLRASVSGFAAPHGR